ncbi:WD40-repeat-containing domain protein [Chytriomyces cf. hyalinus JEL632]|nr:WD40-repeat-containing domain protein [Chytriomyces cf. hyalinus JEL632]
MEQHKHVLALNWTFGLNRSLVGGVHSLAEGSARKVLFYASSHTGVLLDWTSGKQQLLQGHCNEISATAVTSNKRWIVTADKGENPVLIIWDTMPHMIHQNLANLVPGTATGPPLLNALPIKTMFDIHDGAGVVSCEFSSDSKYLVTLGNEVEQTIMIWSWTTESEEPLRKLVIHGEPQKSVKINPEDPFEIVTTGTTTVNFITWDLEAGIEQHVPLLSSKDFLHNPAKFTYSMFIPNRGQAITATADGDVVVWANHSLNNLSSDLGKGKMACVKFMKLHQSAINYLTMIGSTYIVTGGEDGTIKIFDMQLRLILWFEKMKAGAIMSVSFCSTFTKPTESKDSIVSDLNIPEMIVCTRQSKIMYMRKHGFRSEKPDANKAVVSRQASASGEESNEGPEIEVLLETQFESVHALAAHPKMKRFAVGGHSGLLQVWDYANKSVVNSRIFEVPPPPEDPNNSHATKNKTKAVVERYRIESIAYSACGDILGIGFSDGTLRILDAATLAEIDGQRSVSGDILTPYYILAKPTADKTETGNSVNKVTFSPCGNYLAASDSQHAVSLFKKEWKTGPKKAIEGVGKAVEKLASGDTYTVWTQIGKCKAHYKEVISLHFIPPTQLEPTKTRLLSTSSDRHTAEYDVAASSITRGIKLVSLKRIEQTARPLAATWHPALRLNPQSQSPMSLAVAETNDSVSEKLDATSVNNFTPTDTYVLTCNSDFKIRLHNANTQLCRKTALGPTFGGNLRALCVVPDASVEASDAAAAPIDTEEPIHGSNTLSAQPVAQTFNYVAYSTFEKVVGLTKLPFDGNPHKFMGLIAHPCRVSNIVPTCDGLYLLTSGMHDAAVHMWSINPAALEAQIALGGKDLEPFLDMLDETGAGESSPFYKEMEDYFYYAQLRSQGEDAATTRLIQDTVNISEIPAIMQAMGFYPSENDIENMINEVKYSAVAEGDIVEDITFPDLIKLYINHRPVFDYSEADLLDALRYAVKNQPGLSPEEKASLPELTPDSIIGKEGLYSLLQQYGETMTREDLLVSFRALLLNDAVYNATLPEKFSGRQFVEEIMGLQPATVGAVQKSDIAPARK